MDHTGRWKLTEKEREANDAVITQLLAKVELKPGALFMRGFNEGTTKICEMFQKQELNKSESEEIQLRLSEDKKKELLDKIRARGRKRDIERFPTQAYIYHGFKEACKLVPILFEAGRNCNLKVLSKQLLLVKGGPYGDNDRVLFSIEADLEKKESNTEFISVFKGTLLRVCQIYKNLEEEDEKPNVEDIRETLRKEADEKIPKTKSGDGKNGPMWDAYYSTLKYVEKIYDWRHNIDFELLEKQLNEIGPDWIKKRAKESEEKFKKLKEKAEAEKKGK